MKIAIMQPYFFPYIGYFQLMNAVDEFIVYDNIQYTKKGWINRNRILLEGREAIISLPLKKDSDFLDVKDRFLADSWPEERKKLINRIAEAYRKAPFFLSAFPLVEEILNFEDWNLFGFIWNSLVHVKAYLGIHTSLVVSSTIPMDHTLKAENRVLEICKVRKADQYYNPIGGKEIYTKDFFADAGVPISFLRSREFAYDQFGQAFVPWLSIIDVMMFISKSRFSEILGSFVLE